jgi:hypothetical protein
MWAGEPLLWHGLTGWDCLRFLGRLHSPPDDQLTRADARAFLDLAVEIPIRLETPVFDLADAGSAALRMPAL